MELEYLLTYGCVGDFGRFRAVRPIQCRRGERAVIQTPRGLELGTVLGPARPGVAQFLPNTTVGSLLRLAEEADADTASALNHRSQKLIADSQRIATELSLPVEILDAEVLLDGQQAILHFLHWADFDERELVSRLSRQHELRIALHNLATPAEAVEHEEEEHGCDRPDCGKKEGGGCSTCGPGGCSSCGSATPAAVQEHFSTLREGMEERARTPLL